MHIQGTRWGLAVLGVALAVTACKDVLTVSDPQAYTDSDLDSALPAVANGVEGAVHEVIDSYVIYQALLADVYEHTGTWQPYDEVDHGRFLYGTSAMDATMNSLLRARWFSLDAEDRFNRVLGEAEAATSPYMAQAYLGGALADLYIGMAFCEAPADPDGSAVPDSQILQKAIEEFTKTISTANSAGESGIAMAATAGRARANLLVGNFSAAASDAQAIPDGFSYDAKFNAQSGNSVVTLTTATFNKAGGLQRKWWPLIDEDAGGPSYMHDPWTGEYDPRLPVYFDGGVATDNITPHYSQWKYKLETDDIPMLTSEEMRLIEAEVLMRDGDNAGAMAILNALRDAVGLTALPMPANDAEMQDYLLSERFAEMYMEGMRAVDLYRFGITKQVFEAMDDPERPGSGRPVKFSMTDTEAVNNPNIDDDLQKRCLPKTN